MGRRIEEIESGLLQLDRRGRARANGEAAPTPREFEVFRLIAGGQSVTEIADMLHLSVKTISTHRTRILEKTGFRSNAEIIAYAIRGGLV